MTFFRFLVLRTIKKIAHDYSLPVDDVEYEKRPKLNDFNHK